MTQLGLVELAKQGDPQAIAALINHQLQPKGILAKANTIKGCLQIIFEATEVPPQQVIANYIYTAISKLKAPSIEKVIIYGKQTGNDFPVWQQEFDFFNSQSLNDKQPKTLSDQAIDPSIPKNNQSIVQSTHVVVQPVVQHEMQISCPKCGSTQITSNKKGFNVGQALVGGLATGGLGLVAGLWGSNELRLNCLKCGNRWKPRA